MDFFDWTFPSIIEANGKLKLKVGTMKNTGLRFQQPSGILDSRFDAEDSLSFLLDDKELIGTLHVVEIRLLNSFSSMEESGLQRFHNSFLNFPFGIGKLEEDFPLLLGEDVPNFVQKLCVFRIKLSLQLVEPAGGEEEKRNKIDEKLRHRR